MTDSSGGVGSATPSQPIPSHHGRFIPSWAVLHPPVISDTVEFSGEHNTGMDPFVVAHQGWNNFLSSPLLTIAAIVGVGGVLAAVGIGTHRAVMTKGAFKTYQKGFEELDALLLPRSGRGPGETKVAFDNAIDNYLEKYARAGKMPAIIGKNGPSAYLVQTMQAQEKALIEIKRLLDTHPGNEAALSHLYLHLKNSKRLEITSHAILGRLAEIEKGLRAGTGNRMTLLNQKAHLERLCETLEPSTSALPAHHDLAQRYILSQMELLEGINGISRLSQGKLHKQLTDLYASRQKTMIRCLPAEDAFWHGLPSGLPLELSNIAQQVAYAQNLLFRSHTDVLSATLRFRRDRQNAENAVCRSLERLYIHLSSTGIHPLPRRNPISRSGRPRSTAHP